MALALTMTGETESRESRTDDQLMVAYARGNRAAFDDLYQRYRQPIYNYLYRNCRQAAQVDELFQDVWVRLISAAPRYQHQGRFRQWVFTLAHNCLVDFYRKAGKRELEVSSNEEFPASESTSGGMESDRLGQLIHNAVQALPEEQRQAFYLREESGFSIQEIAEIQEITKEAAKSRLRYAYGKLRQQLEGKV